MLGSRAQAVIIGVPQKQKAQSFDWAFQGDSDDDLLSRGIPRTIIGATSFHGPVRNGKAWDQRAMLVREARGRSGDTAPALRHLSRVCL